MLKKITRWLERETVYTQVANDSSIKLLPEFVFKGKGTRTKVNAPENMHCQWIPKGSYHLKQMLKTISHLPNRFNMFTSKNYAIFVLDDYSVHLLPKVKEALLKCGHVYVGIGGGITGDIQVNKIVKFLLDAPFPLPERVGVV